MADRRHEFQPHPHPCNEAGDSLQMSRCAECYTTTYYPEITAAEPCPGAARDLPVVDVLRLIAEAEDQKALTQPDTRREEQALAWWAACDEIRSAVRSLAQKRAQHTHDQPADNLNP